ncbi:hypothetical protein [Desulfovibrio sp. ZJ369]|uniref:hypothetical protein n=1 Tax=Desulfovibrio sp. ZJ369 TaxID=2709793 RepID=UPI0013ECC633|nr:hypothetical protein [Desulfovibrio sp. ZJ369]
MATYYAHVFCKAIGQVRAQRIPGHAKRSGMEMPILSETAAVNKAFGAFCS